MTKSAHFETCLNKIAPILLMTNSFCWKKIFVFWFNIQYLPGGPIVSNQHCSMKYQYLNQCWLRYLAVCGVSRPKWMTHVLELAIEFCLDYFMSMSYMFTTLTYSLLHNLGRSIRTALYEWYIIKFGLLGSDLARNGEILRIRVTIPGSPLSFLQIEA